MLISNKSSKLCNWSHIYQQNGMTAISMAIVIGVMGFFFLLFIALIPIYLENYKVRSHLSNLSKETGIAKMSDKQIMETLFRRFDIDDIKNVKEDNVLIEEDANGITITVEYEVRTDAMANIAFVVSFSEVIEIY